MTTRHLLSGVVSAFVFLQSAVAGADAGAREPQPLAEVLEDFSGRTGLSFTYDRSLPRRLLVVPPDSNANIEDSLRQIFSATEIRYAFLRDDLVLLRQDLEEKLPDAARANAVSRMAPAALSSPVRGEIVVSALLQERSLFDVPLSATVLTTADIEGAMIDDLSTTLRRAPNTAVASLGRRSQQLLSIRGISDISSNEPTAAYLINEVTLTRGNINPVLYDLERIEIIRGPQGATFGRNAVGGAISLYTRKPQPEFSVSADAEHGSSEHWIARSTVNVPVTEKLWLRANAYYETSDGFLKRPDAPGTQNDLENTFFRFSLRYVANDRLTIDLMGSYAREHEGVGTRVPTGVLQEPARRFFPERLYYFDTGTFGGFPENPGLLVGSPQDRRSLESWLATMRAEYRLNDFKVVSVSGFSDQRENLFEDLDGSTSFLAHRTEETKYQTFSQEIRLQSPVGRRIEWLVGASVVVDRTVGTRDDISLFFLRGELGHADKTQQAGPAITPVTPGDEINPAPLVPTIPLTAGGLSRRALETYAVFGEAVWHATPSFTVTAGLRYLHQDFALRFRPSDVFTFRVQPSAVNKTFRENSSFDMGLPRLSIDYAVSEHVRAYASVSRGHKSGGYKPSLSGVPHRFLPESVWSYEAGIKMRVFDDQLAVNLAAFYIDWNNVQDQRSIIEVTSGIVIGDILYSATSNIGNATSKGIEFDLTAVPVPGLTLHLSGGHLRTRFTDFEPVLIDGTEVDLTGQSLPLAPKWTLLAEAEYVHQFNADTEIFIRTEWDYRSAMVSRFEDVGRLLIAEANGDTSNGFPYRSPGRGIWNIRTGISRDNFRIMFFVENVFNKKYYEAPFNDLSINGLLVAPNPRRWGIRLTAAFN